MYNVYMKYDNGEIEFYCSAWTPEEAETIIKDLETEDRIFAERGYPVYNCSYFYKQ